MTRTRKRRELTIHTLWIGAAVVIGSGIIASLMPSPLRVLGYVLGFVIVLAVPTAVRLVLDERNLTWFVMLAFTALAVLGAGGLPAELSLRAYGERVEAEVVTSEKFHTNVGGARNDKYRYVLQASDGARLEPMIRTDPLPGFDEGSTVVVLVDQSRDAEPRLTSESAAPEGAIALLTIGILGVFGYLAIALRRARAGT